MAKKAFEFREFLDVGTTHPVVARLGVQTGKMIHWLMVDKAQADGIKDLYLLNLTPRLVGCHEYYDDLIKRLQEQDARISSGDAVAG